MFLLVALDCLMQAKLRSEVEIPATAPRCRNLTVLTSPTLLCTHHPKPISLDSAFFPIYRVCA